MRIVDEVYKDITHGVIWQTFSESLGKHEGASFLPHDAANPFALAHARFELKRKGDVLEVKCGRVGLA